MPIDLGINDKKKKKERPKSSPPMYDGKPYKRKMPIGWGSLLDIRTCPDYGNVEKVYRVMTEEDKLQMKNYINFLEQDLLNVNSKVILGDSLFGEEFYNQEAFDSNEKYR